MPPRLRKLLLITASLAVALVVLLLIAPLFVPAELYKDKVIAKIEESTGRKLEIRGDIGLRFLPHVQLNLGNAHLSNPANFGSAASNDMVALDELQLSLGFWELLQGRIAINTFYLQNPRINLARNAKGQPNWVFEPKNPQAVAEVEPATTDSTDLGNNPPRITIPAIEINNGTLSYQAAPNAEVLSLTQINARIKMPAFDDQLTIYADTRYNDALPITLDLRLNTLQSWLAGEETAYSIALTADSKLLELSAEGKASAVAEDGTAGPMAKGELRLSIESLKRLSAALNMPLLADSQSEGKISLRSMFNYQPDEANLLGTTLNVDGMAVSGSGGVNLSASRPRITAELSTADTLVMDDLLSREKPSISREQSANTASAAGWSNAPLLADTSALKTVDADVTLSLGGIKAQNITIGAVRAMAQLKNGNLAVQLPSFPLYEGSASADVTVTTLSAHSLRLHKKASLKGVAIGRLLSDAYAFDRLSGKGDMEIDLTMQGISVRDFMNSLNGSGKVALNNGAIKGFNLASILRDARSIVKSVQDKTITAQMGDSATTAQTDFSSLSGSFRSANGIINNSDFALKAPLLDVTGNGTVNLPQRSVDYRLKPKIVGSIEGENRTQETAGGVTVPLRVSGNFEQLRFTPDASGLVQDITKDPKSALKGMEQNVRGLRDDLKSLFK